MKKRFAGMSLALAMFAPALLLTSVSSTFAANQPHQVVVCKYVGTPGVNERLQTGQNPIVVDSNSLEGKGFNGTFPFAFEDAQGNSIAIRWAENSHDGDISECPGYVQPTPTPTETPTATPTETPTATPTSTPVSTPTPSTPPTATPPSKTLPPTDTSPISGSTPSGGSNIGLVLVIIFGVSTIALIFTPRRKTRR